MEETKTEGEGKPCRGSKARERGFNGLFITRVLGTLLRLGLATFSGFYLISLSVQTFPPLFVNYRRGNFVVISLGIYIAQFSAIVYLSH